MFRRRKKLIDHAKIAEETAAAQRAAASAARERQKVQGETSVIMSEVKAHRALLKRNNFAERIRSALGGAGG